LEDEVVYSGEDLSYQLESKHFQSDRTSTERHQLGKRIKTVSLLIKKKRVREGNHSLPTLAWYLSIQKRLLQWFGLPSRVDRKGEVSRTHTELPRDKKAKS